MSDSRATPPGWYPDPTAPGTERYWDGAAWTDHSRPVPTTAPPTPYTSPTPGAQTATGWAAGGVPQGQKPDNYLVWTILSTLLCCLPIGAVGIYFSTRVDKLWAQGDVAGAATNARNARNLAITAAVVSLVGIVAWVVFLALFGEWNVEVNS